MIGTRRNGSIVPPAVGQRQPANEGFPRISAMRATTLVLGVFASIFFSSLPVCAGWRLTFSDEFDGNSIDRSKWKYSDLWGNRTLGGNNEKQCYSGEALSEANGVLRIVATSKSTAAAACKGASHDLQYVSGLLTTSGCPWYEKSEECAHLSAFAQSYGYFEMRAKLPKGQGLWPAFWLVPLASGTPPEIDIMEMLGHQPSTVYQTYHYLDSAGAHQKAGNAYTGADLSAKFSTFGLDWKPGLMVWYIDGREVFRFQNPAVSSEKMYLLLNLAVGGYWPGDPDATTAFPAEMLIDYVRVYQRTDDGTPDDSPPKDKASKANAN
jgi:beta-glucanase (GH16 family)